MAFGSFTQEESMMSEINVTPLVDVMLVLLVVFIITAPLLTPQALKINLPRTQAVAQDDRLQRTSLSIDAQGRVMLDAVALSDEALSVALHSHAQDARFELQVQADAAVNYGRVAQVMAIAQKAGVHRLSFLTVQAR